MEVSLQTEPSIGTGCWNLQQDDHVGGGGLLPTSSQSIYYLGDEAKVMGMFKHGGVDDTILCRVLYKGDWW